MLAKNVNFREIVPSDNQKIKSIIRTDLEEFGRAIPGSTYYDTVLDTLAQSYDDTPRAAYWVVEVDGEIVGGVGIGPFPFPGTAEVQKFFFTPAARGKGIGHAAFDIAEAKARDYGYTQLYIETFNNFKGACGLYEHVGFSRIDHPLAAASHPACNTWYVKELV
ncbi:MAG: GNAT family N-acetyltransferase [Bifidobacteriaceae bacterium]|jgi:putative acetyltransferase|nr:GNAT family N-acetyltransferase [Bifidobacteriaceae bacterium]